MKCLFICLTIISVLTGCESSREHAWTAPYADWESASVKSNGIRIHYWRTGGVGKPVMIMAHGVTDYGLNWASLADKFKACKLLPADGLLYIFCLLFDNVSARSD